MKLRSLTFKAEAVYWHEDMGDEVTRTVEVRAILHADGETLIVTDITPVEETVK